MRIDKGRILRSIGELMAAANASGDEIDAAAERLGIAADLCIHGVLFIAEPSFCELKADIERTRLKAVHDALAAQEASKLTIGQKPN